MLKNKNIVLCKSALCMKEKMKEAEVVSAVVSGKADRRDNHDR